MDLFDAMQVFVRVVERGSFSAVARELNLGQPAVSKQIRALEQHLGGALFARSTRHLALTDQGQRFYAESKDILASLDAARLSFASGQEQIAGLLRVAAPVSFGRLCIAPLVGEFLARHPQLRIDLRLSDQNEDVLKENIDLAIRIGVVKSEGLVAISLGDSPRRVYASPPICNSMASPSHRLTWSAITVWRSRCWSTTTSGGSTRMADSTASRSRATLPATAARQSGKWCCRGWAFRCHRSGCSLPIFAREPSAPCLPITSRWRFPSAPCSVTIDAARHAPGPLWIFCASVFEQPDQDPQANDGCAAFPWRPGKYAAAATPTAPITPQ